MNIYEMDIMNELGTNYYINQRSMAEQTGYSLGIVNRALRFLYREAYLDFRMRPTAKGKAFLAENRPKRAVILAAGVGMRMVPINMESPKALLEVRGERLIERMIRMLHEVGVTDISIVVGFMKEKFEYLIDKYDVKLVVNADYAKKNNLHSLALVADRLADSYIIPCDVRTERNPFRRYEGYSWYMVSDAVTNASDVRVNRSRELVRVPRLAEGNKMIGISYVTAADAKILCERLAKLDSSGNEELFWEEAAYENGGMLFAARVVADSDVVEVNTFEQLREFDSGSKQLKSDAISVVAKALRVPTDEIKEIAVLKKGMTNRSFSFVCNGRKYIMRIPGEGTEQLINRRQEAEVYRVIDGKGLCDRPVYINPENGYKLTEFLEDVRVCDADNPEDLKRCMALLRRFHGMKLSVGHTFDIFGQIEFYESLWEGRPSVYDDYETTKRHVFSMKPYIEAHAKPMVLTHIDANHDNFLFHRKYNAGVHFPENGAGVQPTGNSGIMQSTESGAGMQLAGNETGMHFAENGAGAQPTGNSGIMQSTESGAGMHFAGNGEGMQLAENEAGMHFAENEAGMQYAEDTTGLQLMDWEYAGMQDPDVDLAMFCIYAMYDRARVDRLIDIYYENACDDMTRTKIYCYIACCGLLWSNWCEYKSALGVEFGEYSLRQYRFAKEYYRIVEERLNV